MADPTDLTFMFTSHLECVDELDVWPAGTDEVLNQCDFTFDLGAIPYDNTSDMATQPIESTTYNQAPPIDTVVRIAGHTYIQNLSPSIPGAPDTDTEKMLDTGSRKTQRSKRHGGCRGTHWPGSSYSIKTATGHKFPLPELGAAPSIDEFTQWFTAFGKARRRCRSDGKLPGIVCPLQGCGIHFKKSSELKAHLSFYFNIRAYRCDGCSMDFCTKGNLDRHKKRHCRE